MWGLQKGLKVGVAGPEDVDKQRQHTEGWISRAGMKLKWGSQSRRAGMNRDRDSNGSTLGRGARSQRSHDGAGAESGLEVEAMKHQTSIQECDSQVWLTLSLCWSCRTNLCGGALLCGDWKTQQQSGKMVLLKPHLGLRWQAAKYPHWPLEDHQKYAKEILALNLGSLSHQVDNDILVLLFTLQSLHLNNRSHSSVMDEIPHHNERVQQ